MRRVWQDVYVVVTIVLMLGVAWGGFFVIRLDPTRGPHPLLIIGMITAIIATLAIVAWMIADCILGEFPSARAKGRWLFAVLFLWPMAFVYYFVVYRRRGQPSG